MKKLNMGNVLRITAFYETPAHFVAIALQVANTNLCPYPLPLLADVAGGGRVGDSHYRECTGN